MSEHKPTTGQVRAWCADATDMGDVEFDRWLAARDQELREQTLRAVAEDAHIRGDIGHRQGVDASTWLDNWADRLSGQDADHAVDAIKALNDRRERRDHR